MPVPVYDPESGKFLVERKGPYIPPEEAYGAGPIEHPPGEETLEEARKREGIAKEERLAEEELAKARETMAEAELKAAPGLAAEELSWEEEAKRLFAEYEYLAQSLGQGRKAEAVKYRLDNLEPVDKIPFLEDELDKLREVELQAETRGEDIRARTAAVARRSETRAEAEAEELKRKRWERRAKPIREATKLATEGAGLGVRAAPALVPTRKKDLSLYTVGAPQLELFKPAPVKARPTATGMSEVPRVGFKRTMEPEMYTGVGLGGMRVIQTRGISTPQVRPVGMDFSPLASAVTSTSVDKELLVPMGWSREMGLAWQEIKENGDTDTAEHVQEELETAGVSKGRTATAIRQLKRKGAIRGTRQPGEVAEVLVITGMMTPSEKQPGKYGFRGTGRYRMRRKR